MKPPRRTRWVMLGATMFCYLFFYTGRQTMGFAIPGIHQELGISLTQLGWLSAVLLWSYAIGQFVNGSLADRFGGRQMMTLGATASFALNWVTSLAGGKVGLFIPWGLNGYAQSMGWAPGSRLISNWWSQKERGRAFGFYVFAAGLSSVLAYVTSLLIIDVWELGWRWIFRLPVLLMLLGAGVFYAVARNRPEDMGWDPVEEPPSKCDEGQAEGNPEPAEAGESARARYLAALRCIPFRWACLAIGLQNTARYGLLIWVPVYFLGTEWKQSGGQRWISVALPVGMALGALTGGWLSDRFFGSRRRPVIVGFLAMASLCSFSMYFIPREQWGLGLIVLFAAGFFTYGPQSSLWALNPDLLGVSRAGTGVGVMNTFAYVFAGLGEPLIGYVIETREQTALVFPIVGAAAALAAGFGLMIRR